MIVEVVFPRPARTRRSPSSPSGAATSRSWPPPSTSTSRRTGGRCLGGVAPVPLRVPAAEAVIAGGGTPSEAGAAAAAAAIEARDEPGVSAHYRGRSPGPLSRRACEEAVQPVPEPHFRRDGTWVGASVPRREDPRLLAGRGRFVDDISLPGHAARPVRPQHRRARRRSRPSTSPRCARCPGVVAAFTAADLDLGDITALLDRPPHEFVPTDMPVLARDRVRLRRGAGGDRRRPATRTPRRTGWRPRSSSTRTLPPVMSDDGGARRRRPARARRGAARTPWSTSRCSPPRASTTCSRSADCVVRVRTKTGRQNALPLETRGRRRRLGRPRRAARRADLHAGPAPGADGARRSACGLRRAAGAGHGAGHGRRVRPEVRGRPRGDRRRGRGAAAAQARQVDRGPPRRPDRRRSSPASSATTCAPRSTPTATSSVSTPTSCATWAPTPATRSRPGIEPLMASAEMPGGLQGARLPGARAGPSPRTRRRPARTAG